MLSMLPRWTYRSSRGPVENGFQCGRFGVEDSAVLHPARPPKDAWCHHWSSFHISEKKNENVVFFPIYSRVAFEKHSSLLESENRLKMRTSMILQIKVDILFSFPLHDGSCADERWHPFCRICPRIENRGSLTVCMHGDGVNWKK